MAESAINLTIGSIISGIGLIGVSIEEYNLKNERILELQREIQMISPFIQNLQTSPPQLGIHGRLQKLAILLQQIKSWITSIGQMSKLKHFFFAISHKKQMNKYYLEIKEIKMELGFEMRVGNFQSQTKLNQQMDDLLENMKQNSSAEDYEKIKLLFDTQRDLYDTKLQAHKDFIQEMDLKFNELIQEHDIEIEKLKCQVQDHQYEIESLKTKIQELKSRMDQVEFNYENREGLQKLKSVEFEQLKQMMLETQKELKETRMELFEKSKSDINEMKESVIVCASANRIGIYGEEKQLREIMLKCPDLSSPQLLSNSWGPCLSFPSIASSKTCLLKNGYMYSYNSKFWHSSRDYDVETWIKTTSCK
jgi:hypothetical protein